MTGECTRCCHYKSASARGGGLGAGAEEAAAAGRVAAFHLIAACARGAAPARKPHLTRASSTCSRAACGLAECSVLYRSAARDRTAVTCRRKLAEYGHSVDVEARRVTNRVLNRLQGPVGAWYGPNAAGPLGGAARRGGGISDKAGLVTATKSVSK